MRFRCGQSGAVVLSLVVCTFGVRFPSFNPDISLPKLAIPNLESIAKIPDAKLREAVEKIALKPNLKQVARGTNERILPTARAAFERSIPKSVVNEVDLAERRFNTDLEHALRQDRKTPRTARVAVPFGPHLLVNTEAQALVRVGAIFQEATRKAAKGLKLGRSGISKLKGINIFNETKAACLFENNTTCITESKYRTIDGSCNNLKNPLWGRANTPYQRFLPAQYGDLDGIWAPRSESVFGGSLPLARVISTEIHKKSVVADLHPDISHMAMAFGQFVSHDINRNTLSSGLDGSALSCCTENGTIDNSTFKEFLGCLPIEIPTNDPFFSQHQRTCMNFVRAAPTVDLDCDLGVRQQLNQITHFIDASTVYGSDTNTMNDLRTMTDGLLKVTASVNGDLLLQNTGSGRCVKTDSQHCFEAGDVRVNQHPALMSLHTIFLREHNRVAGGLKTVNPSWTDEELFQEARKIVGAEIQHVTYNEYLPTILGDPFSIAFGFKAQPAGRYFLHYDDSLNPGIRNSFAAAAYRFGHSTVRDHVVPGQLLKDHFLNPALMYQSSKGPTHLAESLITEPQQKTDNLITDQLTNHLLESAAGTGFDLAATNIQRGRDHGLANYNVWRQWCSLNYAASFTTGPGGLVDHTPAVASMLASVYSHTDDIDLWTGVVTETPLGGKALGPTGACIVGRQFWVLKHTDRFYYETNNAYVKFEIEQLDQIRKTTLARIICDNTDLTNVQADVFEKVSPSNPQRLCSSLASIDLGEWAEPCVDRKWSAWRSSTCRYGYMTRERNCLPALYGVCSNPCQGASRRLFACGGRNPFPIALKPPFSRNPPFPSIFGR